MPTISATAPDPNVSDKPVPNPTTHETFHAAAKKKSSLIEGGSAQTGGSSFLSRSGAILIEEIERYLKRYITFMDDSVVFPLAIWVAGTHGYETFDSFGYLVISAATKRAGKTRLMELLSFLAARSQNTTDITPAALFTLVDENKPTLLIDEAERFTKSQQEFRAMLNSGYRRGSIVLRRVGAQLRSYSVYCPKVFVLIGDVYDTLRDRSITVNLRRARSPRRFSYPDAQSEGHELRDKLAALLALHADEITNSYRDMSRLDFLSDREEEIWDPLFALCRVFCPERWEELTRSAVDMSTSKTAMAVNYVELARGEDAAQLLEYGERALRDLLRIAQSREGKSISTADAIPALRELSTGPWRTFRGAGLTPNIPGAMLLALLLEPFAVRPRTIRTGPTSQKATASTAKGYIIAELLSAASKLGVSP